MTEEFANALAEWMRHEVVPKMRSSIFCIVPLAEELDFKMALEVGVALLLDKPLIVFALGNVWIPPRVRQIADVLVVGEALDDDFKMRAQAALMKFMNEHRAVQH